MPSKRRRGVYKEGPEGAVYDTRHGKPSPRGHGRAKRRKSLARYKASAGSDPFRSTSAIFNPAKSAAQYRLAEAVLHGTARGPVRMSKKVAKEIVEATPAKQRSQFMTQNHRVQKENPSTQTFKQRAYANLAKLPKLDPSIPDRQGVQDYGGDQRKAPFPGGQAANVMAIFDAMVASADKKYGSMSRAVQQAPIKKVSLGSLRGLQAAVDADIVKRKINEIADSDELEASSVARFRGRLYLFDGYHTLTALKLGGIKSVDVALVTL